MIRRTPIRKVSARRQAEAKHYSKLRLQFLADKPTCQVCLTRKATDVHHVKGRYGGNYLNVTTWLAVCRHCHTYIHNNPAKARAMGLLE